jgi:lipopolysaccharide assembly outer membrane protein LptD (OstA)
MLFTSFRVLLLSAQLLVANVVMAQQIKSCIDLFDMPNVYLVDSTTAIDSITAENAIPEVVSADKLYKDTLDGYSVLRFEGNVKLQIAHVTITTQQAYLNPKTNNVYIRDKDVVADFKHAIIYGHGLVYNAKTEEIVIDEKRLGK